MKRRRVFQSLNDLHFVGPRNVTHVVTPDGVEMKIVQRLEGFGFKTGFLHRRTNESSWDWSYYDHEDSYWGRARVALDTDLKVATF